MHGCLDAIAVVRFSPNPFVLWLFGKVEKKLSTTRVYSDGRENGRKTFDSHALEARNFRISISLDIPIQIPSPLSAI